MNKKATFLLSAVKMSNTIWAHMSCYLMKQPVQNVAFTYATKLTQSCISLLVQKEQTYLKHLWGWRGKMLTPTCKMDEFSSYREIFSCPLAFISSGRRSWPRDLQHRHSYWACYKRIIPQSQSIELQPVCMHVYNGWRGHNAICYPLCFSLLHYSSRWAESS